VLTYPSSQAHRRDKLQLETATSDNTRNQCYLASSETISPITANPGYPNTSKKQDSDLKSHLMMFIEDFKKDINNSFKKIQKSTGKQGEALKEETHNPRKKKYRTIQPNR
jgi:CRISPR/Cas system endoribonuclease Cas6 (RAMP superfamily)